jgi:hypothetical protein
MMWEIVQPLTGPNIYEEFLDRHGEGIHHVAVDCKGCRGKSASRRSASMATK